MENFKQHKYFTRKTFTFKDDGVEMFTKEMDGEYSKLIHYDDMKPRSESRIYTEKYPKFLQTGLVITAIGLIRALTVTEDVWRMILALTISAIIGLIVVGLYYTIHINYYLIELEDDTQMFIIRDKPNQKAAEEFIDLVFEKRKAFYRDKYFYINYEGDKEKELNRMFWLKSEKLISNNEYNVVIDEIHEKL
jgi:hypothetical protein